MSCRLADSDAAYVLGALAPADRASYEAHLASCASCRGSVAELRGLPALLALAPPVDPGPVPQTLLPGLVARVRRERRRRVLLTAAAALLVVVALVAVPLARRDSGSVVALRSARPVPVVASVRLSSVSWGTRVQVRCTYTGGAAPDPGSAYATYRLVVVPASGAPQAVATWRTVAGAEVVADGSTPLRLQDVAALQLQAGDGTVLLQGRPGAAG